MTQTISSEIPPHGLSERGWAGVRHVLPRISSAVQEREAQNHPTHVNIDLSTSENWLLREEWTVLCREALADDLKPRVVDPPLYEQLCHPNLVGALADVFNSKFAPKIPVDTTHIITAPGAVGCIDALLHNTCEVGDGILLPGPYWSGFDLSIQLRSGVHPVLVEMPDLDSNFSRTLIDQLEKTIVTSERPIKALMICNPHNPLAVCYPREILEACVKFCTKHNIHFFSDEVYALTTFENGEKTQMTPFHSALSLDLEALGANPSRVHAIWSTSKDLGQSGFRVGCIVTQSNRELVNALSLWTYPQVSQLAAVCVTRILQSKRFHPLMEENAKRLAQGYATLTSCFKKCDIPYYPCNAGLYVFAKLAPHAKTPDEEAEIVSCLKAAGVVVSPGQGYHTPKTANGWCRVSFAVEPQVLQAAVDRIYPILKSKRNRISLQSTLSTLIKSMQASLQILNGSAKADIQQALHNHDSLPDKELARLAGRAVDLLHQTEQLLEPSTLVLADCFLGHINSKCLNAAVELQVPDILSGGPKTLSELANKCNAHPHRLRQVLRVLYNNGIFTLDANSGKYSNNATSNLLTTTHWTQWRNWVDLYGNEFYDIGRGIPASCHADESRMAAQIEFDTNLDMFTYFAQSGRLPRLHKTLSGGATAQAPGILEDYPWNTIGTEKFLDIGGGGGGLVALILKRHSHMHAGILDLAPVIEQAKKNFYTPEGPYHSVGPRVSRADLIIGDFLVSVPAFEVYTMKWCLHDWDDSKASIILANIRRSIVKGPWSRLVVFESILADGRMGRLSRYGDITMAITANGMERTEAQWRDLADETGWVVKEIYPLRNAWVCAIEMVPIWEKTTQEV